MANGYVDQVTLPDSSVYTLKDQTLQVYSGTCDTAAGTAIKDVTCPDSFSLTKGAVVFVTFNNTNSVTISSLKLRVNSVNSADAKPIKHQFNGQEVDLPGADYISANQTYQFYYDGTNWIMNTDYSSANIDYGTVLPDNGSEGQVFFQLSDPWYELPAGGAAGQALIKASANDRDVTWGAAGGLLRPNTTTKYYVGGSQLTTENTDPILFNTNVYVENNVLFGAAWNDYAEYRHTDDNIEPGRCVVENGLDSLVLSSARMQPGAEIVSDTLGFAIGQTEKCKTPIAISGRVLAYPYEDINEFKPGLPVCSGPNGTVSIMTEDEARTYPWLIVGTVSAIPQEKTWVAKPIKTINRIGIRVR